MYDDVCMIMCDKWFYITWSPRWRGQQQQTELGRICGQPISPEQLNEETKIMCGNYRLEHDKSLTKFATHSESGGAGWCEQQDELWIRWQWFVEAAENGWCLQQDGLWIRWQWFVEAAENLAPWWQQDGLWKGWKMKCGNCGNLAI